MKLFHEFHDVLKHLWMTDGEVAKYLSIESNTLHIQCVNKSRIVHPGSPNSCVNTEIPESPESSLFVSSIFVSIHPRLHDSGLGM